MIRSRVIRLADVAQAGDFVQIALEESPLAEGSYASAVAPNRISTVLHYPPARTARLGPSPQHLRRNDEVRGIRGEVPRLIDGYEPSGVLSSRAYPDLMVFLLELAGFVGTPTAGGALVTGPIATTAIGVNALNSAVFNVASTSGFEAAGTFIYGGVATTYTGKTATSFTGVGAHAATVGGEAVAENVPVGVTKWVFAKRDSTDAQTARIRVNYLTENVLMEGYGFGVSGLTLNAMGEMSADLSGLYLRRLAADAATNPAVSASSINPFRRGDLYVSALAGGGRISDWTMAIANPLERIPTLGVDPASDWPSALEHGDDEVMVSGSIPKRILASADMDALMAASTFAMSARWTSDVLIGATTKAYKLVVELPKAQIVSGDADELAAKRRHGMGLDWAAAYDETLGYDVRITILNQTTAVKTFV